MPNFHKLRSVTKIYFFMVLLALTLGHIACVRFAGGAGVWHQGVEDSEPTSKQISFDTQNLVSKKTPGNITV